MYLAIMREVGKKAEILRSVKFCISGAAPLPAKIQEDFEQLSGGKLVEGYGLSETSPVTHCNPLNENCVNGSIGVPLPNIDVMIMDGETGKQLPPGEIGELMVKGPNVMLGYLNNEEATRATLTDDGWLHTGDIATVDSNGIYKIVDRLKELIKYKGYQVAPAVLEAVLLSHPRIADAAVIGVNDEDGQEIPKAFVVIQMGEELTEDEVMQFVTTKVAPHEKIRRVEFIELIPKSTAGKILRKDLRAKEAATR